MTTPDLITALLPTLVSSQTRRFNVFDVMHHGTHEKQLSNVFKWLLDSGGTHELGDRFLKIFLDEINRSLASPVPHGDYGVRTEVDTTGKGTDIADLVLDGADTCLVIENYRISDGHGHSFEGYQAFGERKGKRGIPVLLCQSINTVALTDGWESAPVVTYSSLLASLAKNIEKNKAWRDKHPEQRDFIQHMHTKFVKATSGEDKTTLTFMSALLDSGQGDAFNKQKKKVAGEVLADHIRERTLRLWGESNEALLRVKRALRVFVDGPLRSQLPDEMNTGDSYPKYVGRYEFTVSLQPSAFEQVSLVFGPSAWDALTNPKEWSENYRVLKDTAGTVVSTPDWTRLFVGTKGTLFQTSVTLLEILSGISDDDTRIRDAILLAKVRKSEA